MKETFLHTAIFIPWWQIKLPHVFTLSKLDCSLPIYWADIPESIEVSKITAWYHVKDHEALHPAILPTLSESIMSDREESIFFATDRAIQHIFRQFKDTPSAADPLHRLMLFYKKKLSTEKTIRYYLQYNHIVEKTPLVFLADSSLKQRVN